MLKKRNGGLDHDEQAFEFEPLAETKLAWEGFTPYCLSHEFGKPRDRWPPATKSETIHLCALELSSEPQLP